MRWIAQELARVGPTTPTRARRPFDASVDPTEARNVPVAVAAVGRRPGLAILNRFPIDGPLPQIVKLKGDATFVLWWRSLDQNA
jgi:hypothetical protein